MPITTLLWIGPARDFPARLAEDPRFDIVWEERCPARAAGCDLVVLDGESAGARRWLSARKPGDAPVVVRTRDPEADPVWLARGAKLVLTRGRAGGDLAAALLAVLERTSDPGPAPGREPPFVAVSRAMRDVAELVERAAPSRATVLLLGETGTGKEVVARALHAASPRARAPFVALNCAALPDSLLESELFGHARGAFTGAERDRRGAFEEAEGGTLFLDEVGETSGAFQAKLLRVLQDRRVRRLGGTQGQRVDVRIVAATHRDLRHEVACQRFREDLYFRLHVFPIRLAPLRERAEDVVPLAEHFLAHHGEAEGKPDCRLAVDARRRLRARAWTGNARELENEIQRALVGVAAGTTLRAEHFPDPGADGPPPPELAQVETRAHEPLHDALARLEAWLIRRALERHGRRRSETARALGLTREGLYKKMKRLGIE